MIENRGQSANVHKRNTKCKKQNKDIMEMGHIHTASVRPEAICRIENFESPRRSQIEKKYINNNDNGRSDNKSNFYHDERDTYKRTRIIINIFVRINRQKCRRRTYENVYVSTK